MRVAKKHPQIRGLYRKHGNYVYQPPQVKGERPKPIHLSTPDLGEALKKVEDIKRRGIVQTAREPLTDFIKQYLKAKAENREHMGDSTSDNAASSLRRFSGFIKCNPAQITAKMILDWKESMSAEKKKDKDGKLLKDGSGNPIPGLSNASIHSYMAYSRSFCSWMTDKRFIAHNPFDDLPSRSFPQSIPTRRDGYCTKDLRDELINECDYLPLKAVLMVGFHTGMRRQEILNIRPHWFTVGEDGTPTHIRVQNETGADGTTRFLIKDRDIRTIPINEVLGAFLKGYGIEREPYLIRPEVEGGKNKYRWEWKKRWHNYMTKHGCAWVGAHTMKHTFITLLLSAPPEKRPSLLHIERWTGTSTETLAKHYAHLIEDPDLINAAN